MEPIYDSTNKKNRISTNYMTNVLSGGKMRLEKIVKVAIEEAIKESPYIPVPKDMLHHHFESEENVMKWQVYISKSREKLDSLLDSDKITSEEYAKKVYELDKKFNDVMLENDKEADWWDQVNEYYKKDWKKPTK